MHIKRLASGSMAAMARLVLVFAIQIAFVPLYLSKWTAVEFGYWMVYQTAMVLITIPDFGLQAFVEVDYVRRGYGSGRRVSYLLSRNISTGLLLSGVQMLVAGVLVATGVLQHVLVTSPGEGPLAMQVSWALFYTALAWPMTSSVSGSMGRASLAFGSITKSTMWSVFTLFATNVSSALAAYHGASLEQTGAASAVGGALAGLAGAVYFWRDFRQHRVRVDVRMRRVSFALIGKASGLMLKTLFETVKTHSIRLIAPKVIGIAAMVGISVHRTLVGAFQQGFSVVTAPMLPEFVRGQVAQDNDRSVLALMRLQWVFCMVLVLPAATLVYLIGPTIFVHWTHGKIAFDKTIYFWLVMSTLALVAFTPFYQFVQSRNLVSVQVLMSAVGLGGTVLLLPVLGWAFGPNGVASSLALVELIQGAVCLVFVARILRPQSVVRPAIPKFILMLGWMMICLALPMLFDFAYAKALACMLACGGAGWVGFSTGRDALNLRRLKQAS